MLNFSYFNFFPFSQRRIIGNACNFISLYMRSYWILRNNWVSKWNHQLLFVMNPLYTKNCWLDIFFKHSTCCCLLDVLLSASERKYTEFTAKQQASKEHWVRKMRKINWRINVYWWKIVVFFLGVSSWCDFFKQE